MKVKYLRTIRIKPDLRFPAEWKVWAKAKIADNPRLLTNEETSKAEMELGDAIEFNIDDLKLQRIVKGAKPETLPPNYIK